LENKTNFQQGPQGYWPQQPPQGPQGPYYGSAWGYHGPWGWWGQQPTPEQKPQDEHTETGEKNETNPPRYDFGTPPYCGPTPYQTGGQMPPYWAMWRPMGWDYGSYPWTMPTQQTAPWWMMQSPMMPWNYGTYPTMPWNYGTYPYNWNTTPNMTTNYPYPWTGQYGTMPTAGNTMNTWNPMSYPYWWNQQTNPLMGNNQTYPYYQNTPYTAMNYGAPQNYQDYYPVYGQYYNWMNRYGYPVWNQRADYSPWPGHEVQGRPVNNYARYPYAHQMPTTDPYYGSPYYNQTYTEYSSANYPTYNYPMYNDPYYNYPQYGMPQYNVPRYGRAYQDSWSYGHPYYGPSSYGYHGYPHYGYPHYSYRPTRPWCVDCWPVTGYNCMNAA